MRTINSFETGDEQRSDVPASVSRRGLLAGAAGLLAWTSSQAQTSEAASRTNDPTLFDENCSTMAACPLFLTVVTPPRTKAYVLEINSGTAPRVSAVSSPKTLVKTEVGPFEVTLEGRAAAPLKKGDGTLTDELAALTECQLRERVTWGLLVRTRWIVSDLSRWSPDRGVGPSTVELFADETKKQKIAQIDVEEASVQSIRESILKMKLDDSRNDQIRFQDDRAPAYMAFALRLDGQVSEHQVNWMCHLINVVDWYAAQAVLQLKCRLRVPRPWELDEQHAPCHRPLDDPNYSSYPGGHATVMEALHVVLSDVIGTRGTSAQIRLQNDLRLRGLADRIADNRERAGLHTSVDTDAGRAFGAQIGRALVKAGNDSRRFPDWTAVYGAAKREWCATPPAPPIALVNPEPR